MKTLVKWTLADYHTLIETGVLNHRNAELLNGDIVEIPAEGPLHTGRVDIVTSYLRQHLQERALVREGRPITLPPNHEPQPDLAVVRPQAYLDHHPGVEEIYWLIEVSKSTLVDDQLEKAPVYAQAGVPELWIIDVLKAKLWRYSDPLQGQYQICLALTEGPLSPKLFPDLNLQVEKLLRH